MTDIKVSELSGKKIGRWNIISKNGRNRNGDLLYKCVCDCGTERDVIGTSLKIGGTNSCGCLAAELFSKRQKTHGLTKSSEYKIWNGMKNRCYNEKTINFSDYGGRGIKVCDRWKNSFENFLLDMGKRPTDDHSIDRKDVNGDYCPENCKWETEYNQQRNKRNVRFFAYYGKMLTIPEIAECEGIETSTLRRRIDKGMSLHDSLLTPIVLGGYAMREKLKEINR